MKTIHSGKFLPFVSNPRIENISLVLLRVHVVVKVLVQVAGQDGDVQRIARDKDQDKIVVSSIEEIPTVFGRSL